MTHLPAGRVTFLFTDVEGSTRLLRALGDVYADVLRDHRRLLRATFARHGGVEVDTQGDSFFIAFSDASEAVAAAAEAQRALLEHAWPGETALRVRMGLHTGEPLVADGHYVGMDVHRAARIAAAAHGGQIVVSEGTAELVFGDGARTDEVRDLGAHRLKDLPESERIFQLVVHGLPSTFPPLRVNEGAIEAAGLPDYSLSPADVPCPYKGLLPFELEDSDLYFGREQLLDDLAARLSDVSFLAVVGASGSGKSSLVRAGVVPALRRSSAEELRTAIFSPGAHPLDELPPARGAAVVVVDQFEEVFTLCRDEQERCEFIEALLELAAPERRVVVCLRADFYGQCAEYPRLASALEDHQALVGPMTEEELRRAIERPAELAGLLLEPGFVEAILRDLVGQPGALPLLSHSLLETWKRRSGRMLTLIGYLQSGGVQGAIAKTAETVYRAAFSPEQQVLARNTFLRLTELGQGTEDTRRRVAIEELIPRPEQEAEVAEVLRTLADARLVTIGEGTVEVAHEALIRHWPTLREWLDEDREGRLLHRRLTEAAQEWKASGRDSGLLFRGTRLATVGDWATAHDRELNELEREFLTASRQASQLEAERQRRINRRLRGLLIGAVGLLALAVIAGAVALVQQRRAERSADVANGQRLGALALVEKQPNLALLLAVEGTRLDESPETKGALFDTLMKYRRALRVVRSRERILRMDVPARGDLVAVGDNSGHLSLYEPATLARRRTHTLPFIKDLAFAPSGTTVYTVGFRAFDDESDAIRAIDAESGRVRWKRDVPTGEGRLSVTPDGRHLLWFVGGRLHLLRTRDGTVARPALRAHGAKAALPLPGGRIAVVGGGSVLVRDVRSGRTLRRLALVGGPTSAYAVSRDGSKLALGRTDGSVAVVHLATGRHVEMQARHESLVETLRFSPDGSLLATAADAGGRVLVSDVRTGVLAETFAGHGAGLRAVAFSSDGGTLVSGGLDSTLISWDVQGDRAMMRTFPRPGPRCPDCSYPQFTVTPDGERLVLLSADYRVRFLDTRTLRPDGGLPEDALACCQEPGLSPDATRIATVFVEPMAVTLWNARTGSRIRELFSSSERWVDQQHAPPVDTVAYAPDGSSVATNENEAVLLLDPRTGRTLARFQAPEFVQWLSYSPDSRLLEAAADDGSVTVWDVKARKRLWSRRIDNQTTLGGRFSPDRKLLIMGSESGRIHLLDATSGESVRAPLLAHSAYLGSLAFSPDGSLFASSGTDAQTILWDTESMRALGSPFAAKLPSWARFSPDGSSLYILTGERGYVLDSSLDAWIERACSIAGQPLTRAQWTRFMGSRPYQPACAN
ncbi:MAG: PQQ-binding-like beta-propeller repeat protein [Gaiellaceae bacterium]